MTNSDGQGGARSSDQLSDAVAERLRLALQAAEVAGKLVLSHFNKPGLRVDTKNDGSAVTEADRGAERLIRALIHDRFPSDSVVGEEWGELSGSSGFRWIIDPIDGTASFVRGVPLFGTMIAVERDGQVEAGVIRMPALAETVFAARGGGTWHAKGAEEHQRVNVSSVRRMSDGALCATSIDYFRAAGCPSLYPAITGIARVSRGWSDCYAFVLLATGRVEAVVEPKVHAWDVAAAMVITEEAGGRLTDFVGRRDIHAGQCIASNGRVHEELLAVSRTHTRG